MAIEGFDEKTRRLAQYRPFHRGGDSLREVLQDLVLAAAESNDGSFGSLGELQDAFQTLWGLEVEMDELRDVAAALRADGLIEEAGPGICLRPATAESLRNQRERSKAVDDQALSDWETDIRQMRSDVTGEDLRLLREDLNTWLQRIIVRHGAEAAMMLYPEDPRARQLFEEIDNFGLEFLPDRKGCAGEVRADAIQRFARRPTEAQRAMLAAYLNTAFYLTVLTLDPSAQNLELDQAAVRRVYLDTNFLYAVLGVAKTEEVAASHRLLELTHKLGYELAITPWTVRELNESIKRDRDDIVRHRIDVRRAQVMVQVSGEKGFSAAFWRTFLEKGTTPEDYFARVVNFEIELKALGVQVIDEGCTATDQAIEEVASYANLLERMLRVPRHRSVLEHDAKHRLLIERMRGAGTIRFSNSRLWFLTQDTYLPRYAHRMPDALDTPPEMPFCVTPSTWAQIMRALTPRTEDFDQTVVDLLTSPFARYYAPTDRGVVQDVMGRVGDQEGRSPELALAVLQDSVIVDGIRKAAPAERDELVEEAYDNKAIELEAEKVAAEQAADDIARERDELAEQLRAATEAREKSDQGWQQESQRLQGLEHDRKRDAERHAAELSRAEDERAQEAQQKDERAEELQGQVKSAEAREAKRLQTQRTRRRRITAAGVLGTTLLIAVALIVFGITTSAPKIGIVAVLTLCAAAVAARLWFSDKTFSRIERGVAYLFGAVGFVFLVVQLATDS